MQDKRLILFLGFIAASGVYMKLTVSDYSNEDSVVTITARIFLNFSVEHSTTVSVSRYVYKSENYNVQSDLLNKILIAIEPHLTVRHELSNTINAITIARKRIHNLVLVDSVESLRKIINQNFAIHYDFAGYYVIVLTSSNSENQKQILTEIFNHCWQLYIINVYIITMTPHKFGTSSSFSTVYTYHPFTNPQLCNNTTPIAWDDYNVRWNIKSGEQYFPVKVKNMQGCPVYVAIFDTPPFMILHDTRNATGGYNLDGFEGILLRVLSQRLNFSPVVKTSNPKEKWGVIKKYKNEVKASGALGDILNQRANISMGSFGVTLNIDGVMDYSQVYYQSKLVVIIPPGLPYSSFEKLFLPFDRTTWISLAINFVLGYACVFILKFKKYRFRTLLMGQSNSSPFYNMIVIFFGGSSPIFPIGRFARCILIIWMMGSLIIRSSYQGALYNFLQQNKNATAPNTFDKLVDAGFFIYASTTAESYFDSMPKVKQRLILHHNSAREVLWARVRDPESKMAVLTTDDHAIYANKLNYSKGVYATNIDNFRSFPICAFFPRSSYLTSHIIKETSRYLSSGLISTWAKIFVDTKFKFSKKFATQHNPKNLDLHQVWGCIELCLCLYFFSTLMFVIEIVSKYSKSVRNILNYLFY